MTPVLFDAETHTYTRNNRKVPSVTQILTPLYGDLRYVSEDLLAYKSEIGQAVHKACELEALNLLDEETVVPPISLYLQQYRQFVRDTGFIAQDAELRVYSALGYAGTLDLIGILRGEKVLIDIKTTAQISPAVALQTAAYAAAYNEQKGVTPVNKRYALRLGEDFYRLHPYTVSQYGTDLSTFVAFLRVHLWCNANNKTAELPK
jgi:hypothetical protein